MHIAAAVSEAEVVWRYCSSLLDLGVAFKLPAKLQHVAQLNSGHCGDSQIGKVITAYIGSICELERILRGLPTVWPQPATPRVLSEPYLIQNPRLHFRFGVLSGVQTSFDSLGRPRNDIVLPSGMTAPDRRSLDQVPLEELRGAGLRFGVHEQDISVEDLHSSMRCIRLAPLSVASKTDVYLAIDTDAAGCAVLKIARRGVAADALGNDAVSRVRNEAAVLQSLAGYPFAPRVIRYSHERGILMVEDLGGADAAQGDPRLNWHRLPEIIEALAQLHDRGFVHRDLKAANLVLTASAVYLIDYELSARVGDRHTIRGGTNGSIAPEGTESPAAASYDIPGLAAVIFHLATGQDPALLPPSRMHERRTGFLSIMGKRTVSRLHKWCTAATPASRPSSREVLCSVGAVLLAGVFKLYEAATHGDLSSRQSKRFHKKLLRDAFRALQATRRYRGVTAHDHLWRNAHLHADQCCFGINIGAAGILHSLLVARNLLGTREFDRDLVEGAAALAECAHHCEALGLFTGTAGAAVVLQLVGLCLQQADIVAKADALFSRATEGSITNPDLFSGAAGLVFAGTLMYSGSRRRDHLASVLPHVRHLLACVEFHRELPLWKSDSAFDAAEKRFLGCAHGTTGILFALDQFASAAASQIDQPLMESVRQVSREGFAAVLSHIQDEGLSLPEFHGGPSRSQRSWCHGLGGVVWAGSQMDIADDNMPVFTRVAEAWLKSLPPVDNPTVCHGLAGSLDTLRVLREKAPSLSPVVGRITQYYLRVASLLKVRLDSSIIWHSEEPIDTTPDLWVGFSGLACQLLLTLRHNSCASILSRRLIASGLST